MEYISSKYIGDVRIILVTYKYSNLFTVTIDSTDKDVLNKIDKKYGELMETLEKMNEGIKIDRIYYNDNTLKEVVIKTEKVYNADAIALAGVIAALQYK